jgi:hypothetical protein
MSALTSVRPPISTTYVRATAGALWGGLMILQAIVSEPSRSLRCVRWRRVKSLNDQVYAGMSRRLLHSGRVDAVADLPPGAIGDALNETLDVHSRWLADTLQRGSKRPLRDHRRAQEGFERRLRRHWGAALDRYLLLWLCVQEAGDRFDRANRPIAVRERDLVFDVLTGLHARACRTALEVHRLLSGGMPMGALARCRTLHELAVTAWVIADYGRRPEHADLAERFLLHGAVTSYKDALIYQERSQMLGYEPLTDDDMERMRQRRQELIARYGRDYRMPYGWAAQLDPAPQHFRGLEELAKLSHLRGHYKWASHEVHSDAKGWALNVYRRGEDFVRSSGVVNVGLAEPGHLALISLHQVTVGLLTAGVEPQSAGDVLALASFQLLVDDAADAFFEGAASVDRAEARLQANPGQWYRLRR